MIMILIQGFLMRILKFFYYTQNPIPWLSWNCLFICQFEAETMLKNKAFSRVHCALYLFIQVNIACITLCNFCEGVGRISEQMPRQKVSESTSRQKWELVISRPPSFSWLIIFSVCPQWIYSQRWVGLWNYFVHLRL